MKRILSGKLYDTERAECLAVAGYSAPGDFAYWSEELLLMSDGKFALYGEGSCMSPYARATGTNEVSGGEELALLTREGVLEWLERRCVEITPRIAMALGIEEA